MPVALQKRTAKRSRVLLVAHLEAGGESHEVRIRDISAAGALIEAADLPQVDEVVQLHCGESSLEGRAAWVDGSWCGIEFSAPLTSGALVDSIGSRLKVSAPRNYRYDSVPEAEEQLDITARVIRLRDRIR